MYTFPLPAGLIAAAPGLAAVFGELFVRLIALIARAYYRHPTRFPLIVPLCRYIERTGKRLARAMARIDLPCPRRRRPGRPTSGKPPIALPTKRGWLLDELRHEAAYFATRIEALLADPENKALIQVSPQARRLLRPICHMLGVRLASLAIKPEAIQKPPSPRLRGVGCEAGQRRGPSRSDGKGEGAAAGKAPVANPSRPSPLPGFREGQGEGLATRTTSDPYATLCPRMRTRWPFNTLPQFRDP